MPDCLGDAPICFFYLFCSFIASLFHSGQRSAPQRASTLLLHPHFCEQFSFLLFFPIAPPALPLSSAFPYDTLTLSLSLSLSIFPLLPLPGKCPAQLLRARAASAPSTRRTCGARACAAIATTHGSATSGVAAPPGASLRRGRRRMRQRSRSRSQGDSRGKQSRRSRR